MKYKFSDVVDIPKLQKLMETFYSATGILSAILDDEANILIAVGWKDICEKFHRVNHETAFRCRQSDLYITSIINKLSNSEDHYVWYQCKNGLIDAAAPIIIDGEHLATIYTGQLLFEKPDEEQFRMQARRFGFDETDYMAAVADVPIITKDDLDSIMSYFSQLAHVLAQMGMAQRRLLESKAKAIQESKERLKTIIDNTPNVAIQSFDVDGKMLYWNKAAETIFGWTGQKKVGKFRGHSMFDSETLNLFHELIKASDESNQPVGPKELDFTNSDGVEKTVYSTIFPIHYSGGKKEFICMDVDITERKRFEKEMARIDQLNLVGEMAASIGHEVRNPMTTVRGFLQMLSIKDDCNQYKKHFNLMIEELDRANSIITEFLSLAKNKAIKLEKKNLNTIIVALAPLIEANAIVFNQYLKLELDEIPDLLLDEKEIRQLILNLARNGMEAMSSGGCLTIKTFLEKEEIVLSVHDNGCGIDPNIIDKLGTPFFSTKDGGTGLGLAVCYSIAVRLKANISIESQPGGTTLFVRFKV